MNMLQNVTRRALRKARRTIHQWTSPPLDPLAKYAHESYAQEGEDIILNRLFMSQKSGFYVDVGAFHPGHISSTYSFYKRGWRGINIDAMPGVMANFNRLRPRDINLEIAIANQRGIATYHIYRASELNTLSRKWMEERPQDEHVYQVVDTVEVETYPLAEVLDIHLTPGQPIDFMDVDVEGLDLEVIQSNAWDRYRPRVVLVEQAGVHSLDTLQNDPATQYMASIDYSVIAKTFNTVFYVAREQPFDWFR